MKLLFEILSSISVILAIFQKQKWKMMLYFTVTNILNAIMYLAFGRIAGMAICFVAAIRTTIFMIYDFKKLKPNLVWLVFFEIIFIITAILTWQDALDILPLVAILAVGYGSWQDNQTILRVSYLVNEILYILYKGIIGAYISMSVETINMICTIVCLIYYCILKKETPILEVLFKKKKNENQNPEKTNIDDNNQT